MRWDRGVVQVLDAPVDYPQPGQHVRWRTGSRLLRTLHDRPQEVIREQRLRSILDIGPYNMDETYTLTPTQVGCWLQLDVTLEERVPLLGPINERLHAGPMFRRAFAASLDSLKRYCESVA
jgi:hypothetical protein